MKTFTLLSLLSLWLPLACLGNESSHQAYLQQDYPQAISQYQTELQQGHSLPLHYNLANAYYQTGDYARAILHYNKALILHPRHADSQHNLSLAYQQAGIASPEAFFLDPLAQLLPINTWAIIACLGFWWLAIHLLLLPKKTWLNILSVIALTSLLLAGAAMTAYHLTAHNGIIVTESPLTISPSPQSEVLTTVPAGTLVQHISTFKDYHKVQLPQQKQHYWVPQNHYAPIWD